MCDSSSRWKVKLYILHLKLREEFQAGECNFQPGGEPAAPGRDFFLNMVLQNSSTENCPWVQRFWGAADNPVLGGGTKPAPTPASCCPCPQRSSGHLRATQSQHGQDKPRALAGEGSSTPAGRAWAGGPPAAPQGCGCTSCVSLSPWDLGIWGLQDHGHPVAAEPGMALTQLQPQKEPPPNFCF